MASWMRRGPACSEAAMAGSRRSMPASIRAIWVFNLVEKSMLAQLGCGEFSSAEMPTLEQVCKRLFNDSSWFVKCVAGGLLLVVPVAHFFAFGYLYELVARARRG